MAGVAAPRFARDGIKTLLRERSHLGPLRGLETLNPEGAAVADAVIVHPPAGVASADELYVHVVVDPCTHAVITTRGAQKWYRSVASDQAACTTTVLRLGNGATLEWMPS